MNKIELLEKLMKTNDDLYNVLNKLDKIFLEMHELTSKIMKSKK